MPRTGEMPRWDDRILNDSPPSSANAEDQLHTAINELKNHVQNTVTMHNNVLGRLANEIQYLTETVRAERAEYVENIASVNEKFDELQSQITEMNDELKNIRRDFFHEAELIRQQMRVDQTALVEILQHRLYGSRSIADIQRDVDVINEASRRVLDQVSQFRDLPSVSTTVPINAVANGSPQRRPPVSQVPQIPNPPISQLQRSVTVPQLPSNGGPSDLSSTSGSAMQLHQPTPVQATIVQRPPPAAHLTQPPPQSRSEPGRLMYAMAINVRSVKDMWTEYANGINGGPSIRQLENQHGTAWRGGARSAQSRKFQRQRAVYDAIERGIEMGKSADECCQELEQLRARPDGKWYSLTWLLHNIPSNMFEQ
ncbi:transcriptional activator of glycolytic enzymes-domain-containing protein [Lipomyces kononenkoae]|uniref:Transcriptional activator of glycolytic enzymes-domain-containing protein n=1 Tax=Lipomyces kononenkoae TaxID=34357 RepID=A0ACC3T0T8_LIPKO